MPHTPLAASLAASLAWTSAFAQAPETAVHRFLEVAHHLYESLDYERALQQLTQARAHGPTPPELVEISLLEGVVLDESGKAEDARAAFREALFLDPDAKLTFAVSPKVVEELERTREYVRAHGAKPAPRAELTAPPPAPGRSWVWLPAGAGVVLAGTGTYFLIQADLHWQRLHGSTPLAAPAAYATQGDLDQKVGFVLASAGAAALGAAAFFYLQAPRDAALQAAVLPNGAGWSVQLAGSFR